MRFTPQPQVVASSYPNNENDTTRISNSIPGTAETELSWLRQQLQKERTARKEEEERFREHQVMWEKQQEQHENLVREHRLLLGKQKDTEEKLEKVTKSKETLQERLSTRTTENQVLETQLKEQQAVGLSSHDDMVVEMTRLKMDLAAAQEERQKALKSLKGTEAMLDYIKDQYRMAQEAASLSQTSVSNLTKDNAQLSRQASGEVGRLKQVHHDRQFAQLKRQKENQCAEIANLKRLLAQKEEDLVRAKNNTGRMGVGTRAQSATPAPKTRSRAASPMRVSNLRNG
jgi:DNA repair exonuclease SbcCD ATPase subunit